MNQRGQFDSDSGVAASKGVASAFCESSLRVSSSSSCSVVVVGRGVRFERVITIVVVGRQVVYDVLFRAVVVEFAGDARMEVNVCGMNSVVCKIVDGLGAAAIVFGGGADGAPASTAPSMLPMSRTKLCGNAATTPAKTM